MKIYFFPGLGADESLSGYHPISGFEVTWVRWPSNFGTNWTEFISNILLENKIDTDSIFIGISFGGLVAQRLAQKIRPKKIILIGSLSSNDSISFFYKMAGCLRSDQTKELIHLVFENGEFQKYNGPLLRIHGTKDRIISKKNETIDLIIHEGGHLISMTHSEEINAFIKGEIQKA